MHAGLSLFLPQTRATLLLQARAMLLSQARGILLPLCLVCCLGVTGCASKLMQPAEPVAVPEAVQAEEAVIVFFRSAALAGAIQAPVVEAAEDGTLRFVAIVSYGSKYLHRTSPGKHIYIVGGETGELLEATMDAGKTYYTYVTPHMGMWKARFGFAPVPDIINETFQRDIAGCAWVQNTPEGEAWFRDNLASMQAKHAKALAKHQEAEPEQRKVIMPMYGVPGIIK